MWWSCGGGESWSWRQEEWRRKQRAMVTSKMWSFHWDQLGFITFLKQVLMNQNCQTPFQILKSKRPPPRQPPTHHQKLIAKNVDLVLLVSLSSLWIINSFCATVLWRLASEFFIQSNWQDEDYSKISCSATKSIVITCHGSMTEYFLLLTAKHLSLLSWVCKNNLDQFSFLPSVPRHHYNFLV